MYSCHVSWILHSTSLRCQVSFIHANFTFKLKMGQRKKLKERLTPNVYITDNYKFSINYRANRMPVPVLNKFRRRSKFDWKITTDPNWYRKYVNVLWRESNTNWAKNKIRNQCMQGFGQNTCTYKELKNTMFRSNNEIKDKKKIKLVEENSLV